jgi:ATP/ADP translocase
VHTNSLFSFERAVLPYELLFGCLLVVATDFLAPQTVFKAMIGFSLFSFSIFETQPPNGST